MSPRYERKIRPHCLTLAGAWTPGAGRLADLPKHIAEASNLINICLEENPDAPDLLLKKASVLGLQAKYKEASEILLKLNRHYPKKPAILIRLALVFELLRDQEKAAFSKSV